MPIHFALLLSLFAVGLCAQTPPASPEPDYSKEAFVVERSSMEYTFENDGTSSQKTAARIRIQSEAGLQRFAVLTFSYQSATETLEIASLRVHKSDGTAVETPADTAQDIASEITRQAPLYSDLREKHIAVKGLSVGDVLEYEVRGKNNKPLSPGQFWCSYTFSNYGIVLEEDLQISVPQGRGVKWRSAKVKPAINDTNGRHVFNWTYSRLAPKSQEEEESDKQIADYQVARGKFPQPDVQLSSFQSWEEVGRWYNSLQSERAKPTAEIRGYCGVELYPARKSQVAY